MTIRICPRCGYHQYIEKLPPRDSERLWFRCTRCDHIWNERRVPTPPDDSANE
jgi:hypothetical protein